MLLVAIQIIMDFMFKDKITAKNLAEKYELSQRTIMRYLESIRNAGLNIEATRGRNGGFKLVNTLNFKKMFFTNEELANLIKSVTIASELNYLQKQESDNLINKIEIIKKHAK
jgi:predicted DNA-binding transcriptional regulator YafY